MKFKLLKLTESEFESLPTGIIRVVEVKHANNANFAQENTLEELKNDPNVQSISLITSKKTTLKDEHYLLYMRKKVL
jgi:GTPase SAR1 family protein